VIVTLTSKDVIHSFFLPEFRVKQDAVPGMHTRIWFQGNRVGNWEIACAELCGLGHFRMKGFITVDTPADYEKWLAEQASAQNAEQPKVAAQAPSEAPKTAEAPAAPAAPAAAPAAQTTNATEKGGSP